MICSNAELYLTTSTVSPFCRLYLVEDRRRKTEVMNSGIPKSRHCISGSLSPPMSLKLLKFWLLLLLLCWWMRSSAAIHSQLQQTPRYDDILSRRLIYPLTPGYLYYCVHCTVTSLSAVLVHTLEHFMFTDQKSQQRVASIQTTEICENLAVQ